MIVYTSETAKRALDGCVTAALAANGRALSIYDYAKTSGVSARMLIHYFGSKLALDAAIVGRVQDDLRREVALAFSASDGKPIDAIVSALAAQDRGGVVPLLQLLLARSLNHDPAAINAMRAQRRAWREMLEQTLPNGSAQQAMAALEGALIGLMLDRLNVIA